MARDTAKRKHIKAVESSFTIVESIRKLDGATVSELAERCEMAKSTVSVHLATLHDEGYVVKESDGTYALGLKYLRAGRHAKGRHGMSAVVQPVLDRLAAETGEIVWFMVEEHGRGVYLDRALGEDAVQPHGRIGKRVDLHDIAAGKAILASLSDERVREIVETHGLTQHTEATVANIDELFDVLERVRERGYALNRDETFDGFRAVASAVVTDGAVRGALVVSGPRSRMSEERLRGRLSTLVVDAANEVELQLRTRTNRTDSDT